MNIRLEHFGKDVILEAALTARAFGLGEHAGRHTPFRRAVPRAVEFDPIIRGRSAARIKPSIVYRPNAARVAAAAALKYSRGLINPHSLNSTPLVTARRYPKQVR
jgi:hypothetical protein